MTPLVVLVLCATDAGVPELTTVVTASRSDRRLVDQPLATEVISRADIEATGAATLGDLLEEHASVDVSRGLAGQTVRVQGLDMKYLLVLVDGERVTGRIDGDLDLARFLTEDIERVEIVRGPASALYGADAIAGVINVITRRARRPLSVDATAATGTSGLVDLGGSASARAGPARVKLAVGLHRGDGWDRDPTDVATTGPSFTQANASGRLEWQVSERWGLEARAEYFYRDTARVDLGAGGAVFDRRNRTETLTAGLTARGSTLEDTMWRVGAHYTLFRDQFLNDQRGAAALDQYQETWDHLAQLTAVVDRRVFSSHHLTAGLEGQAELLRSERLERDGQRYRVALFAQDEWRLPVAPQLTIVPGLRFDLDTQFGVAPSPRLAVRFDPHATLILRASVGLGFRAPSFRELLLNFQNPGVGYLVAGNPSLQPERSWSVNAGADWEPSPLFSVGLNLFHNELSGLIQPLSDGPTEAGALTRYVYRNVARAFTQGIESNLRVVPGSPVSLGLSYTLLNAIDRSTGLVIEGRAPHRATADLRVRLDSARLKLTVRGALTGPRPFFTALDEVGAPTVTWTVPVATLDVAASFTPWPFLSFGGLAENLLDAGDATLLPLQPRTFMLSISVKH